MENKKRKIYVLIGLIASGKSTWSKQFVKDNPNTYRVSRDDLRFMTTDYSYTSENEKIIDYLYRNLIVTLMLNTDKDIILDEQNLNKERRDKFKEWILSLSKNIEFVEIEFPVTLGEALARDSKRAFPIGEKIIKQTWKKHEVELKSMLEKSKPVYPWNGNLPYCLIVDIDGTLSNSSHRRIFDFKECINDKLIYPVWSILDKFDKKMTIILLSGRGEDCRKETEEWLRAKHVTYNFLYMRKVGDNRADTVIKRELFDEHIRDKYMPLAVIDDRKSVCSQWVEMGIFLFDVSQDPLCKNPF